MSFEPLPLEGEGDWGAPLPPRVPTLDVPADIYDEALAFCNARRAEKGLEPITALPAGERSSPFSCPCSNGTGARIAVCTEWWAEERNGFALIAGRRTDGHPTRFVAFFDDNAPASYTLPVRA